MNNFRTHTGEIVSGDRLAQACAKVADDWSEMAHAIRDKDEYAAHVTQEVKDRNFDRDMETAARIRAGDVSSFTIWQRVNTVLTGECVAFLP